jgi:hypothetical protein
MHAKRHLRQDNCNNSALTGQTVTVTGQTDAQHVHRTSTLTGQTGAHQSPEMARNHLKTFEMHPASHFKLKLPPLVGNA